jgi:hypothetical protein
LHVGAAEVAKSVSYTPPVLAGSGVTWAQLRSLGFQGTLARLAQVNGLPPALISRLSSSQTISNAVRAYAALVDQFLAGDPVDVNEISTRMTDLSKVFRSLAQAADDVNTLIAANPGTVHDVVTKGNGGDRVVKRKRTWP